MPTRRDEPRSDPSSVGDSAILFVCLGNICRSPLAEGVMRHLVAGAGLSDVVSLDSAGTAAYHKGESPDPRSVEVARRRGGFALGGSARQVAPEDFDRFDWILAMDGENLRDLGRVRGFRSGKAKVVLLRSFDPLVGPNVDELADDSDLAVPDPYYGGPSGFDLVYEQVERSCRAFLDRELRGGSGPSS